MPLGLSSCHYQTLGSECHFIRSVEADAEMQGCWLSGGFLSEMNIVRGNPSGITASTLTSCHLFLALNLIFL